MIPECIVLLRIEHFHQCRRRIAAEIAAQFVDLVQHHHRVVRFSALYTLNDLTGQRPDVRAAVSADFRFIVHAAEGDAHEFTSQRSRDGLAKRSLAHAWRPNEAQDRPLHPWLQLFHRQVIENAFLDLLQIVMILVQNRARLGDVDFVFQIARRATQRTASRPGDLRSLPWPGPRRRPTHRGHQGLGNPRGARAQQPHAIECARASRVTDRPRGSEFAGWVTARASRPFGTVRRQRARPREPRRSRPRCRRTDAGSRRT